MAAAQQDAKLSAALDSFRSHVAVEPGAIAAIKVLIELIQASKATTIMGLQIELAAAADVLKSHEAEAISIASGCELFVRFVTRTALDFSEYETCRRMIIERGEFFKECSTRARAKIAELGAPFVCDGATVITTGFSRVVIALLLHAAIQLKRRFTVVVAESHASGPGYRLARTLVDAGIPVTIIDDAAVAVGLERADLVLCGAEGVVENGGVISKVGTCQLAIIAHAYRKPFYIAAESFKFVRQYPLHQRDILGSKPTRAAAPPCPAPSVATAAADGTGADVADSALLTHERLCRDYTPPKYIKLLFTDLGVLTPSAVSDELIKLYY